jgi:hypothetical protein
MHHTQLTQPFTEWYHQLLSGSLQLQSRYVGGLLCHLLKFPVPSFNAVGYVWSLCSIAIKNISYKEHWTKQIISLCSTMANAQLNVKFLTNRRRGQNLALHGYIYRVNRRGPDKGHFELQS